MDLNSVELREREVKFTVSSDIEMSLRRFDELGASGKGSYQMGSGVDIYYRNADGDTIRHRFSSHFGELTTKKKIHGNEVRKEINIRLKNPSPTEVKEMFEMLNFVEVMNISKISHIYYLASVVLAWYTVLDKFGNTLGRFVEVELREDIDWRTIAKTQGSDTEDYCHEILTAWRVKLEGLRIVDKQIKKSLYELFGPQSKT
jgi:predicted adenylyl cyclase CyaB